MTEKTVKTLGVVAAIMIVLTIWVANETPTVSFEFRPGQPLVTDLDVGRIGKIEVETGTPEDPEADAEAETGPVVLERNGREFVVRSKLSYPASTRQINDLISSVIKLRCGGEITEDPGVHADLGVDGASADSKTIRFFDRDGQPMVSVVVGKAIEGGQGYYMRLGSENKVYRSEGYFYARTTSLDYVDKTILNVQRDDVAQVDVAIGSERYTIASPEAGTTELLSIPEGKKAKGTDYDRVFSAATNLSFTELHPAAAMKDLTFDKTHTLKTRADAVYTFDIAQKDDKYFARTTARYSGGEVTIDPTKQDSDEELQRKEALAKARDACEDYRALHQSWVYEVSSWQAENLAKPFTDLIEDDDGKPAEIAASHILINHTESQGTPHESRTKDEAKAEAERLLAEVKADPSKFADLAKEHSSCSSAAQGGDLSTFTPDKMTQAFSDAAFVLEVGAISDVVETEFGYHIIQRTK